MIKGIDHIAVAVRSLEDALPLYRDLLGFELQCIEPAEEGTVRVAVLSKGPHRVELVEPACDDSPISRFLEQCGPGLHHVCLEVEDLDGMLESMREAGVSLIDEAARPGAEGRRIAFIHPRGAGGVLFELSERPASGSDSSA